MPGTPDLANLGDSQSSVKTTIYATRPARTTPHVFERELARRGAPDPRMRVEALSGDTLGIVFGTLAADITSNATSLTLTSTPTNWAASGTILLINASLGVKEVMSYTWGGSGAVLTITGRAQAGSSNVASGTGVAHTAGTLVYHLNTPSALARINGLFYMGVPQFLDVFMGTNDKNYASTSGQSTITTNGRAVLKAAKYSAVGLPGRGNWATVATPALLPADAPYDTRFVVPGDNSTTGGVLAKGQASASTGSNPSRSGLTDPNEHPTISGDFSGAPRMTVWERRNVLAGEAGWGRVALDDTIAWGVQMIAFSSVAPRNWASADSGDTLTGGTFEAPTYTPFSADNPGYLGVQAACVAEAANNLAGNPSVRFIDFRSYGMGRIAAGLERNMAAAGYDQARSWHVATGNQHLNDYGHWLRAQCLLDPTYGIPSSWRTALGI